MVNASNLRAYAIFAVFFLCLWLNFFDLYYTSRAMHAGVLEANPLFAQMLMDTPTFAILYKVIIVPILGIVLTYFAISGNLLATCALCLVTNVYLVLVLSQYLTLTWLGL